MEVTPSEETIEANWIKVLLEYGMVEVAESILDRLAGEEFLAGREVVLFNGSVEVFFGFNPVAVSEDESEGVGGAEAALSCGLFEDCNANSVTVAVGCNHSNHIKRLLIPRRRETIQTLHCHCGTLHTMQNTPNARLDIPRQIHIPQNIHRPNHPLGHLTRQTQRVIIFTVGEEGYNVGFEYFHWYHFEQEGGGLAIRSGCFFSFAGGGFGVVVFVILDEHGCFVSIVSTSFRTCTF
mmetsp:Transcript_10314/g.15510  ORF Transcript_10314/g.15510 Transcript_10314/m.15510 type:complete len:237 (+) Transcript_10314:872-1582(+)